MERLTAHFDYCSMFSCKAFDENLAKENKCRLFDLSRDCCHEKAVYEKLRDYEDAEENGLLLRLPVALGKPCYVIEKCKCNYRYKCRAQNNATANLKAKIVKDWKQYGNMRYCLKIYERPFKVGYMQFYGKTVFATLEEAHKVVTELAERG